MRAELAKGKGAPLMLTCTPATCMELCCFMIVSLSGRAVEHCLVSCHTSAVIALPVGPAL